MSVRRTAAAIAGVLAALFMLALVGPQSVVTAGPAPVAPQAQAAGGSLVHNLNGSPVYLRCNHGGTNYSSLGSYDRIIYEGQDSYGTCVDIDQFRSQTDARCIQYVGPGYTDGWYKISGNSWYKVSDLATVTVASFYYGSPDKCSGRPYFTHR